MSFFRSHWPLLLVVAIAVPLMFYGNGYLGLNSDESVYSGQAAALAGFPQFQQYFASFRAHPLLFQTLVGLLSRVSGASDAIPRDVAGVFSVGTVIVTYFLGTLAYNRKVGFLGSLTLAVFPYFAEIGRLAYLDVPLAFFTTASIAFLVFGIKRQDGFWLYVSLFMAGLALLSKETGLLILPLVLAVAWFSHLFRFKQMLKGVGVFLLTVAPLPASLLIGGGTGVATQYVVWQINRPMNHDPLFYFQSVLLPYMGYLFPVFVVAGFAFAFWRRKPMDMIVLGWFGIVFGFLEAWNVKGDWYLLPVAPAICILAAGVVEVPGRLRPKQIHLGTRGAKILTVALFLPLTLSLAIPAFEANTLHSYAATPVYAGGKQAALWIGQNTPQGAVFLTIGPSMSNIIEYYADRQSYGLSVSSNPINRNPAYPSINNPDQSLASGQIQYLVYDVYSANLSSVFAARMMGFVAKYSAILVYTQYFQGQPVIEVYKVTL